MKRSKDDQKHWPNGYSVS